MCMFRTNEMIFYKAEISSLSKRIDFDFLIKESRLNLSYLELPDSRNRLQIRKYVNATVFLNLIIIIFINYYYYIILIVITYFICL